MNTNLKDQIKQEIDRLHKKGSGDFQTLMRQVRSKRQEISLNLPQLVAASYYKKLKVLEWGRGTGKTTYRGKHWSDILREMPRSTGLFIAPSYQFALTRIIPSLVQGLEMFGLYQGLHYFIGQLPPKSWRQSWGTSFQPPSDFRRYITFWNGVGVHLISQDVPGDGRGLNSDWIDADEAAALDVNKLQENTDPTLRGTSRRDFQRSRYFGSKLYTSSTPITPEGKWFIDLEDYATERPAEAVFISADCRHNAHNLRAGFLEEAKAQAYQMWVYEAEYENKRPRFVKDSFYALLDAQRHLYLNFDYDHYTTPGQQEDCRGDADLVKGVPLVLGVDWGATINCLTVNQHLQSLHEYRTLKSFYVLGEEQKIQDDLFTLFHEYYQYHDTRHIYMWYDKSGNHQTGNTHQTRAEQARRQLERLGWTVSLMTVGGSNPHHELKHRLWEMILREDNRLLPRYRMNKQNAHDAYISMKHARAKQGSEGFQKDKSSERSSKIQRQHATDLSDANDAPIWGMFKHYLQTIGSLIPEVRLNVHSSSRR
jgi:hypothetical protein